MKRIIKFGLIGESAGYIKQQVMTLEEQQKKLLTDIKKINECYTGKDADLVILKYEERVNSLNVFINLMKDYVRYFEWLSGAYRDSHNKAIRSLNTKNIQEEELESIYNQTLSLGDNFVDTSESLSTKDIKYDRSEKLASQKVSGGTIATSTMSSSNINLKSGNESSINTNNSTTGVGFGSHSVSDRSYGGVKPPRGN